MNKKFVIINVEDIEEYSLIVKQACCFSSDNSIKVEQSYVFTDEYFHFKHFFSVEEAIQFCEKERIKDINDISRLIPDLAIIDIDFSHLKNSGNGLYTKGLEFYNYLKNTEEFTECERYIFSAQLNRDDVVEGLKKSNIDYSVEVFAKPTINLDKADIFGLRKTMPQIFKNLAKKYFKKIGDQRYKLKRLLVDESPEYILENFKLKFDVIPFDWKYLLVGWCDSQCLNNELITSQDSFYDIVEKLITDTTTEITFARGDLRSGFGFEMIMNYLEHEKDDRLDKINFEAFNFLIEVIQIIENTEFESKPVANIDKILTNIGTLGLSEDDKKLLRDLLNKIKSNIPQMKRKGEISDSLRLFEITEKFKSTADYQRLESRLKGRRILLGYAKYKELLEEVNDYENLDLLLNLMKSGKADDSYVSTKSIYSTNLGLSKPIRNVIFFNNEEPFTLSEERKWLQTFVPLLEKSIDLLYIYRDIREIMPSEFHPPKFRNLIELKTYLDDLSINTAVDFSEIQRIVKSCALSTQCRFTENELKTIKLNDILNKQVLPVY